MIKIWIASISTIVVLAAVFFTPDQVAYSVSAPGKVLPIREWMLIQGNDGSLNASLRDHLRGTVESYAVNRFERGDAMHFSLHTALRHKRFIEKGDTVGTIYSNEMAFRLTELSGELATAMASRRLYEAGEKPALLEEARQAVARAETRAAEHQKVLDRLQQLYEQRLISEQEIQVTRGEQEIYNADVAIARARLQARQTGARQEQIDVTATEIKALQQSIETLRERLRDQTIVAPLSGVIARTFASDTLFTVRDTTGFLALIPVPWDDLSSLDSGATVDLSIPRIGLTITGTLYDIGDTVERVNGRPVVPAIARFRGHYPTLLPGILVETTIHCDPITPLEYLRRLLH